MKTINFAKLRALTCIEQSFFGLPFLLAALILALSETKLVVNMWHLMWIFPAFFAARICGMSLNQVLDRHIDKKNPRTAERVVASGKLSPKIAYGVAIISLLIFLFAAFQLGKKVAFLSLIAAFFISIYSLTKKIHASCHFVLGVIHFLCPLITYVAVASQLELSALLLSLIAFFSITGNEVIYAIQDLEFDRKEKLHSIPVSFGAKNSLWIALFLYVLCLVSITLFGMFSHRGGIFYLSLFPIGLGFFFLFKNGIKRPIITLWMNAATGIVILFFLTLDMLWIG